MYLPLLFEAAEDLECIGRIMGWGDLMGDTSKMILPRPFPKRYWYLQGTPEGASKESLLLNRLRNVLSIRMLAVNGNVTHCLKQNIDPPKLSTS